MEEARLRTRTTVTDWHPVLRASGLVAGALGLAWSTGVLVGSPAPAATVAVTPQMVSPRGVDLPRKIAKRTERRAELGFGPKRPSDAPDGISGTAGRTWSPVFRLYGALPPWFDDTWKPNVILAGTPTRAPPASEGATA